jgi:two-component system sensor histidine kinase KdpD
VALLTFFCYQTHIDFPSAIPLYTLLVVLQSLTGDFWSSVVISVLSAGCLDFFFTEPLFSLYMRNPMNGLALVAFVFTALVITRLLSRVREEATSAKLQKDRLDRLYQLSQQLLALESVGTMSEALLEPFRRVFGATAVCIFDASTAEFYALGDSRHQLAERTRDAYLHGLDLNDADSRFSVRCLRLGAKLTGAIGFEGPGDVRESADALAALAAGLVESTNAHRKINVAAAIAQAEIYRSAMLDALAHEFKTPLATIMAAAGAMRQAGPLVTEQHEMADTVESEAERLGNLTSRLLRTARLDREEIRPQMELTDIASLAAQIARRYSEREPDRRILVLNSRETVEVPADTELFRLTLSQLVDNACKYSKPGSTVRIEIDQQGDFATVKVSNTGSSVPYSEHHRIFERFYRGLEVRNSISGTGLGLFVARKIALAHGGTLELESQSPAHDCVTFCLKIPLTNHVLTTK